MPDHPKMICAQEFVLVDEEGSPRANWAIDDGGQASINFLDRDPSGIVFLQFFRRVFQTRDLAYSLVISSSEPCARAALS